MKRKNDHIPNQVADFFVERDVFGQIKNMKTSDTNKHKYKPKKLPDLDVNYAGLWSRSVATFIDLVIVVSLSIFMNVLLFFSNDLNFDFIKNGLLITIAIWILYNGFFESSLYQATIGEMFLNLKIVNLYGKRLSIFSAFFRCIITIFSILPLGLGVWYIATALKKQSWHDLLSGTLVIKQ